MSEQNIKGIIECILFACGTSIPLKNIASIINKSEKETKNIIFDLMKEYQENNRGFKIIQIENSFQICTNPEYFPYIKNFFTKNTKKSLSQPVLETLAIIAYKQPVTKAQIEYIRGVNCEHSINTLIKYDLVEEKGRLDIIGKPILFGTTEQFLKYFGFSSLEQMPNLEDEKNIELDFYN